MRSYKGRLAYKYAKALLESLGDIGVEEAFVALGNVKSLLDDPGARSYLLDPTTSRKEVNEVINRLLGELPDTISVFLKLLVSKRRLQLVTDIMSSLKELDQLSKNQIDVFIRTATKLSEEDEKVIGNFVAKHTKKAPELKTTLDDSLIAGAIVSFDDYTLDLSIRGRLKRIQRSLETADDSAEVIQ